MNAFKSFWIMFKRFKTSLLMNLMGLSVALAAFVLIMIQVTFENNYETQNPKSDRIYRASLRMGGENYAIWHYRHIREIIEESPHIVHWSSFLSHGGIDPFCTVTQSDSTCRIFKENKSTADPGMIDILGLEIMEGDTNVLKTPRRWLMPQSTARKMFGKKSAVGQLVDGMAVGAVYKDRPQNSVIRDWMFFAVDKPIFTGGMNYIFLLELSSPDIKDEFVQIVNAKIKETFNGQEGMEELPTLELTLLKDLYYTSDALYDIPVKGDLGKTRMMVLIAILVILIAVINYVNFASALTPMRIKMINLQKVMGARVGGLRLNLLFESVAIALMAYFVALGMIHALGDTSVASYFSADISLAANVPLLVELSGVALLVGMAAGLYPLYYMTSFQPIMVLKGAFGMSPKGRKYRLLLLAVQFVISFVLITCTIFINCQNQFVSQYDLGFNKDQVVYVEIPKKLYQENERVLTDYLTAYNDIENVGFALQKFGSCNNYMFGSEEFNGKDVQYNCLVVSPSFLDVMDIRVPEGRNFKHSDKYSLQWVMIFNQQAKALDGQKMRLGGETGGCYVGEIIGFLSPEFHFMSLRQMDNPMCFAIPPAEEKSISMCLPHVYIKVKAGATMEQAAAHIKEAFAKVDPAFIPELEFMDGVVNSLYQKEQQTEFLVAALSVLAIVISLVGVFGLVLFETQYRRKEIGIRRVHGASIEEILMLINRKFLYIITICFLLSIPVSYKFTEMWLSNFAYRIDISWWVFAISLLIIGLITVLTVTVRSYGAATENPSNSIKSE